MRGQSPRSEWNTHPSRRFASTTRPVISTGSRELLQEPEVVLVEEADVLDPVAEHGHALDAHPEGPARHLLGVVAHRTEDLRMDHPRAQDLEPPRRLADAAAGTLAAEAEHVHLGRRLREREEGGPE